MKKIPIIIILLSFISAFSFSQQKTEIGVTTEGAWFMPKKDPEYVGWATKKGFGAGVGVYASRDLFWKVSAELGLTYRYKQMQQQYDITESGGGFDATDKFDNRVHFESEGQDNEGVTGWDKLPMHYIVVPFHLKMRLTKNLFVKGGIESTWLTNYEVVNEKPEFNWIVGIGSQQYKLKWSVNYIRGFKEQGFGDKTIKADGHYLGSINRNNMLQLQLSYPIWQLN